MSKYNNEKYVLELQQRIANIISYILFCYDKGFITEKTKNKILELCNPDMKGGE